MKALKTKLFEIQKKNISVSKDWENSFFKNSKWKTSKYVTLENLMKVLSPILLEFNLLLYHKCEWWYLKTIVTDMDSWEIEISEFQLTNTDPQKQWAAITYAKRYNTSALFNITTEKDDDWNKASNHENSKKQFTERSLNLLKWKIKDKNKNEIMQMILEIKKTMNISEDMQKEIDLLLNWVF